MKTLEDLKALREKLKADMKVRQNDGTKIIIGMGTCGIAAGAREVMSAVLNELAVRKLNDVQVQQTGCIGMCEKVLYQNYLRQQIMMWIVRKSELSLSMRLISWQERETRQRGISTGKPYSRAC